MMAKHLRLALLLASVAGTSACGPSSPEELTAEARRAIAAGELRTAEIHLKNLLQQEAGDVEARRLLGEVSLAQGNAVGAEQELRRARELGADPAAIHLPLLRALLAQGKFNEVIEQVVTGPSLDGENRIAELGMAGAAYRGLGSFDEAERAYRAALEMEPKSAELRSELARVLLQSNRADEAVRIIADVLTEQPEFVPALLLRGLTELQERRYEAAEATLQTAVRLGERDATDGTYSTALAQLIEAQLAQQKIDEAAVNADVLLAANPAAPVARYLKARIEAEQGDVDAAERRLEAVIADAPQFWQAHALLGAINLQQDQLGQAQMYLQTVINNQPQDVTARLRLAELYVRQGEIESAKQLITGDDVEGAGDALFFALIGRASLASGQPDRAAEYFEQSEQSSPQSAEELVGVASLYVAAGEFERAVRVIEGSSGDEALSSYLLTLVRLRQGDSAGAAEAARQVSEELPDAVWPLNLRGAVALSAGDVAAADEFFSQALEIEPDNVATRLNAARAAAVSNDGARMAEHLRHVIEIEPEHTGAAFGLAVLAADGRDFDEARSLLEGVPQTAERLRLEGEMFLVESRFDEAASAFKRAFALQPSVQLALRAYTAANRAGRGEPEAELLIWSESHPRDVQASLALSSIALSRGEHDEAIRRLESVIAVDPIHAAALNNLAWLYGERGDTRAEDIGKRAYEAEPDNPAIADTLGWILVRNGDAAEGLPLIERAAEEMPDQHEVRYHFGVALAETGDAERALGVLRDVLETGEEFPGRADAAELAARLEGR